MLLYLLSQPVELEGGWWAQSPLKRDTLILPDDSVPQEKDAKIVIKAYQRFYFSRPKHRSIAGATLIAGQRWIEKDDVDMKRRYEEMGYKFGYENSYNGKYYDLYYYPIPKVDSLIVYVRSKEKYCSLKIAGITIRMLNEEGKEVEAESYGNVKKVLTSPNRWDRIVVYFPKIMGPNSSFHDYYGIEFGIGPDRGSIDSCATFEVGPIYLK